MAVDPEEAEKGCWQLLLIWGVIALGSYLMITILKGLLIYLLVS
jgi:hypothetical protein